MKAWLGVLLVAVCLTTTASAQQSSPAPAERKVRISFLPPPLEGTISLGVYDGKGKLVRVLHREDELDAFEVGADALHTKWDGKNDAGENLPAGKYSARGFAVGDLDVQEIDDGATAKLPDTATIKVKLVENPLAPGARPSLELTSGFDDEASYLQTADGLPLYTVDETYGIARVALANGSDKSIEFYEDDGDSVARFRVSGVDKIMAFDCGGFELK